MKAKSSSRGASKKQPCTGCGDKGIQNYMKGKPDAKAAFVSTSPRATKAMMKKGGMVKKKK